MHKKRKIIDKIEEWLYFRVGDLIATDYKLRLCFLLPKKVILPKVYTPGGFELKNVEDHLFEKATREKGLVLGIEIREFWESIYLEVKVLYSFGVCFGYIDGKEFK